MSDPMKNLIKQKLEQFGLKKADGRSIETFENIMQKFYSDKIRKLIQITRADHRKLNDNLNALNVSKTSLADGGYLHAQKVMMRNKFKGQENIDEIDEL